MRFVSILGSSKSVSSSVAEASGRTKSSSSSVVKRLSLCFMIGAAGRGEVFITGFRSTGRLFEFWPIGLSLTSLKGVNFWLTGEGLFTGTAVGLMLGGFSGIGGVAFDRMDFGGDAGLDPEVCDFGLIGVGRGKSSESVIVASEKISSGRISS